MKKRLAIMEKKIIECDFASTGLSENVKSIIATADWNLGGYGVCGVDRRTNYYIPYADRYTQVTPFANRAYNYERSNNVYDRRIVECNGACNDNVTRTLTWVGKVGLVYSSNFGYAIDLSTCIKHLFHYGNIGACASRDN